MGRIDLFLSIHAYLDLDIHIHIQISICRERDPYIDTDRSILLWFFVQSDLDCFSRRAVQ